MKSTTDHENSSPIRSTEDLEKGTLPLPKGLPTGTADQEYPTGLKLALIITSCALAMFLVALDRTIIATAIPHITDDFSSLSDVGWYASSYLISSCATQLLWGRIYTFYSPKNVFLFAVGLFELGSLLCGIAQNSVTFIVGRAIAGMGSAAIFSGTMILVAQVIPLNKRPMFVGIFGSIFGVSSIIGPLLGGAFTDKASWRWCFLINLPIGAVTIVILVLILHVEPVPTVPFRQQLSRVDPFGTLVFLPGIICFLLALQWGGSTYAWNSARIIVLFVLASILLFAFIGIQIWKGEDATLPPRIISQRSVACGAVYATCVGGAMISLIYFIPIWFQAVKGVSAVQSGIDMIPFVLSLVTASIVSGATITKTGWYNPFVIMCCIFMSVGAGLITTWAPDTTSTKWIGYQIIFGFGLGMGMQQSSLAAQAVLSKKDMPIGVSLMFFSQSLGGSIFVCISQSVFLHKLISSIAEIHGVDASAVLATGATELWTAVSPENLAGVLVTYNEALRGAFIVALAAAAFSIIPALGFEWKNVKGLKQGGPSQEQAKSVEPTDISNAKETRREEDLNTSV